MKRRNLVFGSVLAVTLVVGAAALAVRTLASPERIVGQIQEKVRAKTGHDLAVGALDVRYLPRPAIHARDVALEGYGKAGSVTTEIQLFPLLMGRVRPGHVLVEGATIANPKGGDDWRVDRASFDSGLDWHGVTVDASVSRNGQVAHVLGKFADISRIGQSGEKTRGKVEIEWEETRVAAEGDFRLDGMRGHAVKATLHSDSLDDMFAFVGVQRDRTAPLEVTADVRDEGDTLHFDDVRLRLGQMHAKGSGTVAMNGDKPVLDAKFAADRLDWKQALVDMGHARKPQEPSNFVFRDKKLAWKTFTALRGMRGKVDFTAASMKLGNGIELQQPRAKLSFEDDRVKMDLWQSQLLGGTGHGSMRFDGARKTIHFDGTGDGLLLERWFKERGKDHHFTSGPMQVRMSIDMHGDTWRDLASSVTGPVSIRMGSGVYARERAGEWESLMVAFSKKDSTGGIQFECAAANLRFENGVARGDSIVGARSTVSRLLTSGVVDLREEHVDLRGKLRTPPGSVGLAAIANDLQVEGPLRKLHVRLDPEKKPATIVKGIAAIATAGLSALATAAANSQKHEIDPCQIVGVAPASEEPKQRVTLR